MRKPVLVLLVALALVLADADAHDGVIGGAEIGREFVRQELLYFAAERGV